jgi:hypothetical protein
MKTLLLAAFSLTTALVLTANAAKPPDQDEAKPAKKQQRAPSPRQAQVPQPPKQQRNPNMRPQNPVYRAPNINPVKQAPQVRSLPDQDAVRRPNQAPDPMPRIRPNPSVVVPPTVTVQPNINPRRHDWDNRDRTDRDRTDRDRTDRDRTDRDRTDRNWQDRHSNNNNSWEHARRRHHHNHHHRDWWRSRYSRFALFGAGYYFWDNGYWFPAYGYDPSYNTYAYSEPIYGYNDLEPAQVITSVQTELQRQGYYRYAVDGEMGPATRAAIANYQRDNGLSITSAIDEPTLQSLGLD